MATRKSAEPGCGTSQHFDLCVTVTPMGAAGGAKPKKKKQKKVKKKEPVPAPKDAKPQRVRRQRKQATSVSDPVKETETMMQALRLEPRKKGKRPASDPRNKSSFLGNIVDRAVGGVADALDNLPIVGPVTGAVGRAVQHGVRGVEDTANAVALGIPLFLILIFMPVATAQADHECPIDGVYRLSNQCKPSDIWYYDGNTVVHNPGCVPCIKNKCAIPWFMTVSYFDPNTADVLLCKYVDTVALGTYACYVTGVGELCTAAVGIAEIIHRHVHFPGLFSCNCNCSFDPRPGNEHKMFFEALWDKVGVVREIASWILDIPLGVIRLALDGYPIVTVLIIMHASTGNWLQLIILLLMTGYCTEAGLEAKGRSQRGGAVYPRRFRTLRMGGETFYELYPMRTTGTMIIEAFNNFTITNTSVPYCHHLEMRPNGSETLAVYCYRHRPLYYFNTTKPVNLTIPHVKGTCRFLTTNRTTMALGWCVLSGHPEECRKAKCFQDCTYRDPSLTYEKCGISQYVSSNMTIFNNTLKNTSIWLVDMEVPVKCDYVPKGHFPLRMPGRPIPSGGKAKPCKGYAWPTGAIGSGLIILKDGEQYLFAQHMLYHLHWATHVTIFCLFSALTGARIAPVLFAILSFHLAEAAMNPSLAVGASVSALVSTMDILTLLQALILVILCHNRTTVTSLMIITKIALGYPALTVCGLFLLWKLPGQSVSGAELSVCVTVHDYWWAWLSHHSDWVWFAFCWLCVLHFIGLTHFGKCFRARIAMCAGYLHEHTRIRVEHHFVGQDFDYFQACITFCFGMIAPLETYLIVAILYGSCVMIDLCYLSVISAAKSETRLEGMIRFFEVNAFAYNKLAMWLSIKWADRLRLPLVFNHLSHLSSVTARRLRTIGMTLDPVGYPQEIQVAVDHSRDLACGDYVRGRPVFARLGDIIFTGRVFTPPIINGKRLRFAGPLSLAIHKEHNIAKTIVYSIMGRDRDEHTGSIVQLGTPLTSCMGFIMGSNLITVAHGSNGRSLATRHGLSPGVHVPGDDIAIYQAPGGMTPLHPCTCAVNNAYMFTAKAQCIKLTRYGDKWLPDVSKPLSFYKGSSGTPILCALGHVIQMFTGVSVVKGVATRVIGTNVDLGKYLTSGAVSTVPYAYPKVPRTYEVQSYVAPTGSGKSTKLPLYYANQGHKVLVAMPSVAAVSRIVPYMSTEHNINVSWHAGNHDVDTGSILTYTTYGKLLSHRWLMDSADVIICDECHASDPTSMLGMGMILTLAPTSKAKLVIMATATPPGCFVTPHPNITEVALDDGGDVDFYGKKIDSQKYLTGRHVIFCASKAKCHEVQAALGAKGVKAMVYYRGLDAKTIPETGPVVVCATDALCIGYNGSFDTVTDCCTKVEEGLTIDLAPTITTAVRTVVVDSATRMQRRGRCGRGAPGIYYYVQANSSSWGVASDAAVYECFDTGIAWYDMKPQVVRSFLTAYQNESATPSICVNLDEAEAFFNILQPMSRLPQVLQAKETGFSFALITGIQAWMCQEAKAPAPTPSERWKPFNLHGANPVPLLANLDDRVTVATTSHSITKDACAALGAKVDCWFLTLGLAAIAAVQIIDSVACLVIKKDYHLSSASGKEVTVSSLWDEILEECAANAIHGAVDKCIALGHMAIDRITKIASRESSLEKLMNYINTHAQSAGAGLTVILGIIVGKHNPGLSGLFAGVGAYLATVPFWFKMVCAFISATILSVQGSVPASAATVMGALGGGMLAGTSIAGSLFGAFLTVGTGVAAADVAYSLLCGKLPPAYRLFDMMAAPSAMGGALLGVVFALLLKAASSKSVVDWTNRLLAMSGKNGPVCTDYFLKVSENEDRILKILHELSICNLFIKLSQKQTAENYVCDNSFLNWCQEILWSIIHWIRVQAERLERFVPKFSLPFFSCTEPASINFKGNGHLTSTCACGAKLFYTFSAGNVEVSASTAFCRNGYRQGVVVSNDCKITEVQIWPRSLKKTYRYGMGEYIEVENRRGALYITRSTTLNINRQHALWCLGNSPVMVGEAPWFSKEAPQFVPMKEIFCDNIKTPLPALIRPPHYESKYQAGTEPVVMVAVGDVDAGSLMDLIDLTGSHSVYKYCVLPNTITKEGVVDLTDLEFTIMLDDIKSAIDNKIVVVCTTQENAQATAALLDILYVDRPVIEKWETGKAANDLEKAKSMSCEELLARYTALQKDLGGNFSTSRFKPSKTLIYDFGAGMPTNLRGIQVLIPPKEITQVMRDLAYVSTHPDEYKNTPVPGIRAPSSRASEHTDLESTESSSTGDSGSTIPPPPPPQPKLEVIPSSDGEEGSSEWETTSESSATDPDMPPLEEPEQDDASTPSGEVHKCSMSYSWTGLPLSLKPPLKQFPIQLATVLMGSKRNHVYLTDPREAGNRKVTINRDGTHPPQLLARVEKAKKLVSNMKCKPLTFEEAARLVQQNTARSNVSGISGKDVRSCNTKAREAVEKAKTYFRTGVGNKYLGICTLAPKVEIFCLDPKKGRKPPRYICFPPLETRVWEKMVLGDVAYRVTKHVMGETYGAIPPHDRAAKLVKWWKECNNPVGFCCDAICFDSQITPEDQENELAILRSVKTTDEHRDDMAFLYRKLYEGSPLCNTNKDIIGYRYCRASGVYTTASGNYLTMYLKLMTALEMAGIKAKVTISGDDVAGVFEADGREAERLNKVAELLAMMGCKTKPIEPIYNLELIETCSSNVTYARTRDGRNIPIMTRDPSTPLARAMCETGKSNPADRWLGNILMFAGTYWARWLIVGLLDLWCRECPTLVEAEIYGNKVSLRKDQVVPVALGLCGPDAFNIKSYTIREVSRVGRVTEWLGYQSHRDLLRRAIRLRARIIKHHPDMHCLLPMLNFTGRVVPIRVKPMKLNESLFEQAYESQEFTLIPSPSTWKIPLLCGIAALAVFLMVVF